MLIWTSPLLPQVPPEIVQAADPVTMMLPMWDLEVPPTCERTPLAAIRSHGSIAQRPSVELDLRRDLPRPSSSFFFCFFHHVCCPSQSIILLIVHSELFFVLLVSFFESLLLLVGHSTLSRILVRAILLVGLLLFVLHHPSSPRASMRSSFSFYHQSSPRP